LNDETAVPAKSYFPAIKSARPPQRGHLSDIPLIVTSVQSINIIDVEMKLKPHRVHLAGTDIQT